MAEVVHCVLAEPSDTFCGEVPVPEMEVGDTSVAYNTLIFGVGVGVHIRAYLSELEIVVVVPPLPYAIQ